MTLAKEQHALISVERRTDKGDISGGRQAAKKK
jgi:hypothetical protein